MSSSEAPDSLALGALFGRYKGWRSAVDAPTAAPSEGDAAPEVAAPDGALIVQFEATAKEDLRVGFAAVGKPQWRYELALGFSGNTEVAVRKFVAGGREIDLAGVFSGRTLSGDHFIPYWVVVQQGSIVAGIGKQVGVDPVMRCVDPKEPVAVHQVALTTWNQGATVRNFKVEFITDEPLPVEQWTPRLIVRGDPYGDEDLLAPEQRAEYEREYEVIQKRVSRFGGEFIAPDLKKFLDPKVIRRLQRTGATERGFATGFDLASESEISKREARMKRFDTPKFGVEFSTDAVRALTEGMTQEEWAQREAEKQKLRERAIKFGLDPDANPKLNGAMKLKPASRKVREERCDVKTDTMVEFRDDAIHVYSLDENFQQVRTNDVMEYFTGYGPWYVEWINDSSCTVVFEDAGTAGRALIALSKEVPPQTIKGKKARELINAGTVPDAAPKPADPDADVDMDADLDPSATTTSSETPAATANEPAEVPDESFNRSQWRYGNDIGSATQAKDKRWRLLLRRATTDDFPPEKNKKYHARRSHPQQRGRGHRDSNNQSRNSARAHPYGKGGRNRRGEDSEDRPRGGRRGGNREGNSSDGLGLLGSFEMPARGSSRKVTEVADMDD